MASASSPVFAQESTAKKPKTPYYTQKAAKLPVKQSFVKAIYFSKLDSKGEVSVQLSDKAWTEAIVFMPWNKHKCT